VEEHAYFGGAKDICPNFPKLARKLLGQLLCVAWRPNFGWPTKNVFMWLWAPFSQIEARWAPFVHFWGVCPDFQGFCKGFHRFCPDFPWFCRIFTKSKLLGVTPASYTTELKYLYFWNKIACAKKRIVNYYGRHNMNETHWFQVSISCWKLETISIYVHKTPVEYFEYTVAPRRWPLRYHDHFNAVFPIP